MASLDDPLSHRVIGIAHLSARSLSPAAQAMMAALSAPNHAGGM
jgi:hypothetical protein